MTELSSIKTERNQLIHHFWRALNWPFQKQADVRKEFELANHLCVRMTNGELTLANYIETNDKRIRITIATVDTEKKHIVMPDGSKLKPTLDQGA